MGGLSDSAREIKTYILEHCGEGCWPGPKLWEVAALSFHFRKCFRVFSAEDDGSLNIQSFGECFESLGDVVSLFRRGDVYFQLQSLSDAQRLLRFQDELPSRLHRERVLVVESSVTESLFFALLAGINRSKAVPIEVSTLMSQVYAYLVSTLPNLDLLRGSDQLSSSLRSLWI